MIRSQRRARTKDAFASIQNPFQRFSVRVLDVLDLLVYALVGVAFIGAASLALVYSVTNLLSSFGVPVIFSGSGFAQNVLGFVSDLLLVLIIMEVLGTIRSYLEKGDTSVKPFLFIGIISATRGILSIGAQLSISGNSLVGDEFRNKMIELGINAVVIVALGATIRILGNYAVNKDDADEQRDVAASDEGGELVERVTVETKIPAHQHFDAKAE